MDEDKINHIANPDIIAKLLTRHFQARGKLCLATINSTCKAETRIVDNDPEAGYLLLDALPPPMGGALEEEPLLEVRGLIESLYSWFRTNQLRVIVEDGERYYEIPYPDELLQLQRRDAFRIGALPADSILTGEVEDPDEIEDFSFEAQLTNLSTTGAQMTVSGKSASLIYEGTKLHNARVRIPKTLDLMIDAEVRNCRPGRTEQELTVGLEFLCVTAPTAQTITRAVMKLQRRMLAESEQ